MGKGQENERELCKIFSRWWTEGERDDIFWRTPGSGARASVRTRLGKNPQQGFGDMLAEDPSGQVLVDCCFFEFKKGYPGISLIDCIASRQRKPILIQFLEKLEEEAKEAGKWPVLVFQIPRKSKVICLRTELYDRMNAWHGYKCGPASCIVLQHENLPFLFVLMKLDDFLKYYSPEFFKVEGKIFLQLVFAGTRPPDDRRK